MRMDSGRFIPKYTRLNHACLASLHARRGETRMPLRRASTMQDAYVAFEASRCMSVPGDQGKDSVAFVDISAFAELYRSVPE